jgi:hypothetical protein
MEQKQEGCEFSPPVKATQHLAILLQNTAELVPHVQSTPAVRREPGESEEIKPQTKREMRL